MALLNPVNALVIPFLFLATIPLALFASFTTLLAVSVLSVRALLVYLDLALSLLPRPLLAMNATKQSSAPSSISSASLPNSRSPSPTLMHRRRRRRSSAASLISASSATGLSDTRGLGLIPSIGQTRDYEGIGGWRLSGTTADDEAWTSVTNPRLELPTSEYHHYHSHHHYRQHHAGGSSGSNKPHHTHHHHHRSLSGGPVTPGDGGYLMMKARTRSPEATATTRQAMPNSSRARTPPVSRPVGAGIPGDSYFPKPSSTHSPKATRRS